MTILNRELPEHYPTPIHTDRRIFCAD